MKLPGTISFHSFPGQLSTRVNPDIVNKLLVPVLPDKSYIDRFISLIQPTEIRIIPYDSQPIPISHIQEAISIAEHDKPDGSEETTEASELLVKSSQCEPNYILVFQQKRFKARCEAPVSVFTQAADLIEVVPNENMIKIMHDRRQTCHGCLSERPFLYYQPKFW